jgi:hypothetical protein
MMEDPISGKMVEFIDQVLPSKASERLERFLQVTD